MNREYLKNRLMIVVGAFVVSLGLNYFHGDAIDASMLIAKILTISGVIIVFSVVEYYWKRRRNA